VLGVPSPASSAGRVVELGETPVIPVVDSANSPVKAPKPLDSVVVASNESLGGVERSTVSFVLSGGTELPEVEMLIDGEREAPEKLEVVLWSTVAPEELLGVDSNSPGPGGVGDEMMEPTVELKGPAPPSEVVTLPERVVASDSLDGAVKDMVVFVTRTSPELPVPVSGVEVLVTGEGSPVVDPVEEGDVPLVSDSPVVTSSDAPVGAVVLNDSSELVPPDTVI
ncbi:unnamed protein product, partial [Nippostrongylus brasiliensis]|uniref:Aggrecan core protein n=1 Tax=Nippostrongylus brasiliensis TaxID=27835 RepID=A0A0N4XN36_NIPBR